MVQVALGRTATSQQLARVDGGGGEAAVVADALNDVMGKMLTVVTKKTKVREIIYGREATYVIQLKAGLAWLIW